MTLDGISVATSFSKKTSRTNQYVRKLASFINKQNVQHLRLKAGMQAFDLPLT